MKKLSRRSAKSEGQFKQVPLGRDERVAMIQDGLHNLACELGLMAAQELLKAEVEDLCGPMHQGLPGELLS